MLVLLPLTMWGQEGYWKQIDKDVKRENDGEHFEGVKMDGSFGRFTMRSKQLKDGKWGNLPDHDNCKGEWLYEIATYTEPQKYYKAGDVVKSTIHTSTSHSPHLCGVPFYGGSSINYTIWTGYSPRWEYLYSTELKNDKGENYIGPKLNEKWTGFVDVDETISAVMPKGGSRSDSLMGIWVSFVHGRGEDAITVKYTYEWVEGEKPVEKLYSTDEMLKQKKKSGPGKWIWIPVITIIGTGAGGGVYWIRRRIKQRKAKFTDKDKEELRRLHRDYQEAQLEEGKDAMKWDTFKGVGVGTGVVLDIAGDVSTAILANTVGAAGTPVMGKGMQTGVAALKTFLKGMATDYANDKDLLSFNTIGQNLTKAGADAAKTFLTCSTVGNAPSAAMVESFWAKMGLNVGVDTATTFITDLWDGKSLRETGKDVTITIFKSAVNTKLGDWIGKKEWYTKHFNTEKWKVEKVLDSAQNTIRDYTANATANAVTNAAANAGANTAADAVNRIIIEKVNNPVAEKAATLTAENGIDWFFQKAFGWGS